MTSAPSLKEELRESLEWILDDQAGMFRGRGLDGYSWWNLLTADGALANMVLGSQVRSA